MALKFRSQSIFMKSLESPFIIKDVKKKKKERQKKKMPRKMQKQKRKKIN